MSARLATLAREHGVNLLLFVGSAFTVIGTQQLLGAVAWLVAGAELLALAVMLTYGEMKNGA